MLGRLLRKVEIFFVLVSPRTPILPGSSYRSGAVEAIEHVQGTYVAGLRRRKVCRTESALGASGALQDRSSPPPRTRKRYS